MLLEVRRAGAGDVGVLASVLAGAFVGDPVACFIFPDRARRAARLCRFFEIQLRHNYLPRGIVLTDVERRSCSMWLPPAPSAPPLTGLLAPAMMPLLVGARSSSSRLLARLLAARHPTAAHWYLGTIGTDPAVQRSGLGSALMREVLDRCDSEQLPSYLECSLEDNVIFYARRGFEVTEELEVPGGPRLWLMWRPPRPPPTAGEPL